MKKTIKISKIEWRIRWVLCKTCEWGWEIIRHAIFFGLAIVGIAMLHIIPEMAANFITRLFN